MNSFSELSLVKRLSMSIDRLKFVKPTAIQAQTIPAALEGKDVIGCAETGSGKTAAFVIPMIAGMLSERISNGLILAPTRELAAQIVQVCRDLTQDSRHLKTVLVVGGMGMQGQISLLSKNPAIVVATPGRLIDHLKRRTISLDYANYIVVDEADRMFDMGFAPQVTEILDRVPQQRQTLLFTATLSPEVERLKDKYLHDPVEVKTSTRTGANADIAQSHLEMLAAEKNDRLKDELKKREGSVLVFARTKIRADRLTSFLHKLGLQAACIHGGRTQAQRNRALDAFRRGETRILIATDVAARGIDVPQIAHVINYDLPQTAEDYIHRVGRTGRAGNKGNAISFVTTEDRRIWKIISKRSAGALNDSSFSNSKSEDRQKKEKSFGRRSKFGAKKFKFFSGRPKFSKRPHSGYKLNSQSATNVG